MASMNIFDGKAFEMMEMTQAFEESEYLPQELAEDFTFKPVTTEKVAIEIKKSSIQLIPTSERGAEIDEATGEKRKIVDLRTPRLAKGDKIYATEVANIRKFGSETETMQVQDLVTEKIKSLDDDMELSHEKMRLAALKGLVIDPKNDTILYDMYSVMGETKPAAYSFKLANKTEGTLIKLCNKIKRDIKKAAKGAINGSKFKIKAKVGSKFWDDFVSHPDVEKTYLNWSAAADLRGSLQNPYSEFTFGGITWKEYEGTDDDSKVAIEENEAIIYPVGVKDNLVFTASPSDEHFEFVNTKGKRKYTMMDEDSSKNKKWVRPEIYSYPLFYCARPLTLRRATGA